MKICVVTPLFALSGVPLAQLKFARALAAAGYDVDLIIGHINQGYQLPNLPGMNVIVWDVPRVVHMMFPLVRYLKKARPEAVFSAEDHLNGIVLLAALVAGSKAKVSGSSRVTPFDTYSNTPFTKRWILKWFMRVMMSRASALTCVSKDMVDQYRQVFKSAPHTCIYNIVDDGDSKRKMNEPLVDEWFLSEREPTLVAAGRLASWKGFPDLILAMKEVVKARPAKLAILGDGPMRDELQALIDELDLSDVVKLYGYVENPLKYFCHADVFVLSSYVEGLPNVLVEAMMCGCTPVSTDCPTGPREVLHDGKYGILVPVKAPVALAYGIVKALDAPIPASILQEAIGPFSEREVIRKHFESLGLDHVDRNAVRDMP